MTERRRPGRPPKSPEERAKREILHVSVTLEQFDAICTVATRYRLPVSHAARALMVHALSVSSLCLGISRISENPDN